MIFASEKFPVASIIVGRPTARTDWTVKAGLERVSAPAPFAPPWALSTGKIIRLIRMFTAFSLSLQERDVKAISVHGHVVT